MKYCYEFDRISLDIRVYHPDLLNSFNRSACIGNRAPNIFQNEIKKDVKQSTQQQRVCWKRTPYWSMSISLAQKDQTQISSIASSSLRPKSTVQTHARTLRLLLSFSFPASHRILSKRLLILSTIDSIRSDFGWNFLSLSHSVPWLFAHSLAPFSSVALSLSFSFENWNNHYRIVYTLTRFVCIML